VTFVLLALWIYQESQPWLIPATFALKRGSRGRTTPNATPDSSYVTAAVRLLDGAP